MIEAEVTQLLIAHRFERRDRVGEDLLSLWVE
jgi:hypothetical protein